ncbi:MAG: hypothetical protein HQK83_06795 [Fibrobacteria bacterium]|nr:hypothetical protein [Fibrobacteria bacterium]
MIKETFSSIFLLLILSSVVFSAPQKVIFETDMESDFDDAGALAMLHAMADNGECEILAVMHNTSDPYGPGVIDAINTWYYRPDLPIGKYPLDDCPSYMFGGEPQYARAIALDTAFHKDVISRDDVPDAVELYKDILAEQEDSSVIIISVGWQMNLQRLAEDSAGSRLIVKKIKELVVMGGYWNPSGKPHMNLAGHKNDLPVAARAGEYIVNEWPTPVAYVGMEAIPGVAGGSLEDAPYLNPVRRAYEWSIEHSSFSSILSWNHHTADLATILYALRGPGEVWTEKTEGTPAMWWDGSYWRTEWKSSPDSPHRATTKSSDKSILQAACDTIEALMVQAPVKPVSINFEANRQSVTASSIHFDPATGLLLFSDKFGWYNAKGSKISGSIPISNY